MIESMKEIERLRAESLASRTVIQDALEAIGEAASALEHQQPAAWSPGAVARLRCAADALRQSIKAPTAEELDAVHFVMASSGRYMMTRLSALKPDAVGVEAEFSLGLSR